jgi:hypothetical protein
METKEQLEKFISDFRKRLNEEVAKGNIEQDDANSVAINGNIDEYGAITPVLVSGNQSEKITKLFSEFRNNYDKLE